MSALSRRDGCVARLFFFSFFFFLGGYEGRRLLGLFFFLSPNVIDFSRVSGLCETYQLDCFFFVAVGLYEIVFLAAWPGIVQ